MSQTEGVRARARRETVQQITDAARRQLAEVGAAALSVRAVTRQLGMAPSAVYRYFPHRDALLTTLIVEAYQGIADAAEGADAAQAPADAFGRWLAVHRGTRAWALEHPHEFALVYGSPVPGYAAPEDTIAPAARIPMLMAGIAVDAWQQGHDVWTADGTDRVLPDGLLADAQNLVALVGQFRPESAFDPDAVDPRRVLAVLDAWTEMFGGISFELHGHYRRVIDARAEHLDAVARRTARAVGIPVPD